MLISLTLIVRLKMLSRESRASGRRQQPWISSLISLSFGTALVTSAFALAGAIAYAINRDSSNFVVFVSPLTQLYALCLLFVLRSRRRLQAPSTLVSPSVEKDEQAAQQVPVLSVEYLWPSVLPSDSMA